MENESLRNKLEDIVALKQEYGIGSQDAFAYLRSQDNYGKLRDSILENLRKEGLRVSMSVRELSKLCEVTREVIGEELSYAGTKIELETEEPCMRLEINEPFPKKFFSKQHLIEKKGHIETDLEAMKFDEIDEYIIADEWRSLDFDYESFFTRYFIEKSNSRSDEWFDVFIAEDVLNSGDKFFIDADSQEHRKYSFFEITDIAFLRCRRKKDFYEGEKAYLIDCVIQHSKNVNEIIEERKNNSCTEEERRYLLHFSENQFGGGGQLYDRANRERVLGRLEIERKIALFQVMTTTLDNEPPDERIDSAASYLRRIIRTYNLSDLENRIQVFSSDEESKNEMIQRFRETAEEDILPKGRYILRALIKNRRWLVNYLSR